MPNHAPDDTVDLGGFPVIIELAVLWGHMDPFQHVNNVVYFRYLESARVAYADRIALYQVQQATGIGPILASTSCDFIRPLRYRDTIRVGCRTVHLTEVEIRQEHAIFSERQKRLSLSGPLRLWPTIIAPCVVQLFHGISWNAFWRWRAAFG